MSRRINDVMTSGYNNAVRLIRTEMNFVNNSAAYDSLDEVGILYYEFIAVLDNRTSKMCQSRDGEVYPMSEKSVGFNFPPIPNMIWVGDITYIKTAQGWLYLAIVKDLCTKKVVVYSFSNRIDSKLVCEALKMAINRQKPSDNLIFHSDRSSQYSSYDFRKLLAVNHKNFSCQ